VVITAAVEGLIDEAMVRRLCEHIGVEVGRVHGKNGKGYLHERIAGYNNAARFSPWIVLVDLNREADCPPPLRAGWLPEPAPNMCFRVVVRTVESWLFADRDRLARFLGFRTAQIPGDPEAVDDAKRTMVEVARHSRRRDVRQDMVPRPGSGSAVGPAYTSRLIEFVATHWRPEVAARSAESLQRSLTRLRGVVEGAR